MASDALIAELLRGQGAIMERLDALEKLICDDAEEDKKEDGVGDIEAKYENSADGAPFTVSSVF